MLNYRSHVPIITLISSKKNDMIKMDFIISKDDNWMHINFHIIDK